ncbi:DUF3024 domain-containing protein [Xanthobacter agilis]|jgi:hypothetical protein|uniref:DUF3024 domain-containing protein n=1 Tax=Xanthobacter agilis TaxID=47492 RepID=A0ABU0LDP3_XANAG|nr:hypothetical protein [Xanthobacter agilis]MDQ0505267.1 hypothetical protein [Xanthobacter agilis]
MRLPPHPNDLDRKRIERTLKARKRYRYVEPRVLGAPDGYRIESACCSRNVDPDGGVVDIALLRFDAEAGTWHLFRKNHEAKSWELDSTHPRLVELLQLLNDDSERKFWQ